MFDTIIVPIDLTQEKKGRDILARAKKLGGDAARIVALHVLEDIPAYVAYEMPADFMENSRRKAEAALNAIVAEAGGGVEAMIVTGHPATEIIELAEKIGADLIMVASHRPGLQDYFIGSTAARVVRHAACSVLVVR